MCKQVKLKKEAMNLYLFRLCHPSLYLLKCQLVAEQGGILEDSNQDDSEHNARNILDSDNDISDGLTMRLKMCICRSRQSRIERAVMAKEK